ncbi:hypothetical protein M413DRAFT_64043 [Hebeloma cylindrosporum]|uniref:Uncharacterized protein n=1 Tax=Hebeloma cylindrosporum TaxID=76867 RepID=A0A0C3CSC5_HEBCY|nr:hypothetical protein M413DRAFT_64043 [Hebeloma cylindrosporum h7]
MQSTLLRSLPGPTSRRPFLGLFHCRRVCLAKTPITLARLAHSHFSQHHSSKYRLPILKPTIQWRITRDYSSQMTDIFYEDPNRADLFYHFVQPPTPLSRSIRAFAVSFLNATPASPDSETIIGWLPAQTYQTDTPDTSSSRTSQQGRRTTAGLHDFIPNPQFLKLLHKTIQSSLAAGLDEIWDNGAKQVQQGWMHIHGEQPCSLIFRVLDQRNVPALGRIGDPDDIIASVLIEDSKIKPETYQAMPSYRVCTTDGILQLTPGLAKELHRALIYKTKEETSS